MRAIRSNVNVLSKMQIILHLWPQRERNHLELVLDHASISSVHLILYYSVIYRTRSAHVLDSSRGKRVVVLDPRSWGREDFSPFIERKRESKKERKLGGGCAKSVEKTPKVQKCIKYCIQRHTHTHTRWNSPRERCDLNFMDTAVTYSKKLVPRYVVLYRWNSPW